MAVDVDRHCYHGVFTYNIFLFLAFSLTWEVFRTDLFDLWLCSLVSSYGHVGKFSPFMGLKPNMVVHQCSTTVSLYNFSIVDVVMLLGCV